MQNNITMIETTICAKNMAHAMLKWHCCPSTIM